MTLIEQLADRYIPTITGDELLIARDPEGVRMGIYLIDTEQIPSLAAALFRAMEAQPNWDNPVSTALLSIGTGQESA